MLRMEEFVGVGRSRGSGSIDGLCSSVSCSSGRGKGTGRVVRGEGGTGADAVAAVAAVAAGVAADFLWLVLPRRFDLLLG
jgi:hypothetical protein